MKTFRIGLIVLAVLVAATVLIPFSWAQGPGLKRTDLMRNDLSIPGREALQVLVEFAPGATAARHAHPGEELVYVVSGALEYRLDGRPPATLTAGQVLFIPAGTPHTVKNLGDGKAAELATYIVEKGKPLVVLSPQ
jgi:quercetin dioxygenase-like cupin family protein